MSRLLHIETATGVCSVALSLNGELVALRESVEKNSHASLLAPFIDGLMHEAKIDITGLDAIAVSKGPGSYTGLRIGVASAKGLCCSLDIPLIAVSTLQSMAMGMKQSIRLPSFLCPMIDARRMEVYTAVYEENGKEIRETLAEIIDENSFAELLSSRCVTFGGDGAEKCRSLLGRHSNALFLSDFQASAKFMITLAEEKYKNKEFEDPAYFEPFYLKDFIAGKPRVKGLDTHL